MKKKIGRRPAQAFLQRRHTDGQQTYEKMFNVANHQEMQIKATMRYHHIAVRVAFIQKTTDNRFWRGYGEKETSVSQKERALFQMKDVLTNIQLIRKITCP